eukprot:GILK01010413.1.p1 GENE.GILK01010413.1~~GILK01010413.1.p1  ORF type:complete len:219 (+),score=8.02 GILK01010413.1:78-734(+)
MDSGRRDSPPALNFRLGRLKPGTGISSHTMKGALPPLPPPTTPPSRPRLSPLSVDSPSSTRPFGPSLRRFNSVESLQKKPSSPLDDQSVSSSRFGLLSPLDAPRAHSAPASMSDDIQEQASKVTAALLPTISRALVSKDKNVFGAALKSIGNIARMFGPVLNEHLDRLLAAILPKMTESNKSRIYDILHIVVQNGGETALDIVKLRVPDYEFVPLSTS